MNHPRARRTSGFTLIEVLVSLIVLGIGLLGVAKLMLVSTRTNDSAYLRTQALELANGMLDNMRANRASAVLSSYQVALGPYANPGVNCLLGTPCTAAQLATYDLYQWKTRLSAPTGALPGGDGTVTMATAGSDTTATITVQWDDTVAQSTLGSGIATQSVTLETVL